MSGARSALAVPLKAELHAWIRGPCREEEAWCKSKLAGVRSLQGAVVVVAGRQLHASHALRIIRGVVYCKICGSYTSGKKPEGLVGQCPGEANHSAKQQLAALRKEKLPAGLAAWPSVQQAGRKAIRLA